MRGKQVHGSTVRGLNHSRTALAALVETLASLAMLAGLADAIASSLFRLVLRMD